MVHTFNWVHFINISMRFQKPLGSWNLISHPNWDFFAPVTSTRCGVFTPPIVQSATFAVSVFYQAFEDRTTTFQMIEETCTGRSTSTSATGWPNIKNIDEHYLYAAPNYLID